MERCIYNPSHVILTRRYSNHLTKCRLIYLNDKCSPYHEHAKEIQICPFDPTHHIHMSQMKQHVDSCQSAINYSNLQGEVKALRQKVNVFLNQYSYDEADGYV